LIEDNNNESKDSNKPKDNNNNRSKDNNNNRSKDNNNNRSNDNNNRSKDNNNNRSNDNNNRSKDNNNKEPINDLEEEKELHNNEENIFKNGNKTKKPKTISHEDNLLLQEKERVKKEQERNNKEIFKRKQDEKNNKVLSIENFPELTLQESQVTKDNNYVSFLDKIKLEKIENEEKPSDNEFDNLEIGWQLIKRDLKSGVKTVKYKSNRKPYVKTDLDLAYDVIYTLSSIHEKRTKEYIDRWGDDEWNAMFRFQNYDYEYFDKLDELYEDELDEHSQNELDERNNEDYDNGPYNSE
jgi:hypothetical protein